MGRVGMIISCSKGFADSYRWYICHETVQRAMTMHTGVMM